LKVERVMQSLGLAPDQAKGYEAYLEGRVLELATKAGRKELGVGVKPIQSAFSEMQNALCAGLTPAMGWFVKGRFRFNFFFSFFCFL
jgi:hypothetical protein